MSITPHTEEVEAGGLLLTFGAINTFWWNKDNGTMYFSYFNGDYWSVSMEVPTWNRDAFHMILAASTEISHATASELGIG